MVAPGGRAGPGFTLLELLVVVAIISLLVVILAPSITNALSLTKAVICGNNLREISKSLAMRTPDEGPMRAVGWTNIVLKHIVEKTLICPEDGEVGGGDFSQVRIKVQYGGTHYLDVVGTKQSRRVSNDQYEAWRALFVQGRGQEYWDTYTGYEEDANPDSWWVVFEDLIHNSDYDFNDIKIRAIEDASGNAVLYPSKGDAGASHWLVWADTLEDALTPPGPFTPGDTRSLALDGGLTSYGINSQIPDFYGRETSGRVVMIDYEKTIVHSGANPDDWDNWDDNGDGRPSFARHLGRFNVLTTGGEVERRHPDDINPDPALFPGSREAHWTP